MRRGWQRFDVRRQAAGSIRSVVRGLNRLLGRCPRCLLYNFTGDGMAWENRETSEAGELRQALLELICE